MKEAESTYETLVNFYHNKWRYSPDDSCHRTHRQENLKYNLI